MNASDALALISVVIAVNALVSALLLRESNRDKKSIKKNMESIEKQSLLLEKLTHELIEWVISKDIYEKNESGVFRKILKEQGYTEELKNFDKVLQSKKRECKRNMQHLMLFSTKNSRKSSAHKQLVNAYGDAETLFLLKEMTDLFEDNEDLIKSINALKERIKEELNIRRSIHISMLK